MLNTLRQILFQNIISEGKMSDLKLFEKNSPDNLFPIGQMNIYIFKSYKLKLYRQLIGDDNL